MASQADPTAIATIRRLAEAVQFGFISPQAQSDLLSHGLKRADLAAATVDWIDAGERVKPTVVHSFAGRTGDPAFEMKPRLNDAKWYIKLSIDDVGGSDESLALLSAHPDH